MFNVADKTTFFILSRTWVVFRPTSDCRLISVSFDHPLSTSIMILYWCTSYPLNCSFSSYLNGPYFVVFSSLFFFRLLIHGQLISQTSHRPGWLAPPDDLHTQVYPTKLLLFPSCTPPLASLTSTTVVLPQEDLGHVRSRRTGLLKPFYA